jgi:hypothetical protein
MGKLVESTASSLWFLYVNKGLREVGEGAVSTAGWTFLKGRQREMSLLLILYVHWGDLGSEIIWVFCRKLAERLRGSILYGLTYSALLQNTLAHSPHTLTPAANLWPVSLAPVANLPPVLTTPAVLVAKFAAGVVDTGGAHSLANISTNFRKNSKWL